MARTDNYTLGPTERRGDVTGLERVDSVRCLKRRPPAARHINHR